MLSDKQVKALKPNGGKERLLADGGGLYVRASVHGSKTFVYRSRVGKKQTFLTLGEYPALSLASARTKVGNLQGNAVTNMSVAYGIAEYLKSIEGEFQHPGQVRQRLTKDILPTLGSKRLASVTTSDLTTALQTIVDRGAKVSANRTLADVRHLFDYCHQKGWIASDPSIKITRKVVGGREKSRDRVLTDDELKKLIEVMRGDRFELRTRIATLLLIVTGQRSSEILKVKKEDIAGQWWTIPKEQTKNKKPQKVFLTHISLWLLRQVDFDLGGDHRTISRALRRMKVGFIPRDIRRTMSTMMSDLGVMPHVVEKCLNHTMVGVMAVYNKAEYLPERKEAWRVWAKYVLAMRPR